MSKFNSVSTGTKTMNLAGGEAFQESPNLEFVSILLTTFLKDKFYRSESEEVQRIITLMNAIPDKKFLAKSAIYARTKYGMRSVSHLVAGLIATMVKGEQWTKHFFDKIVYRPDDMTEILSCYCQLIGKKKPIPNAMKKGFGLALGRFDEYSLAKYRGEGKGIKLIDLVNLIHPQPTDKNKIALEKLVKGTLTSSGENATWESELTMAGQVAQTEEEKVDLKDKAWSKLIKEKRIGIFAVLRNLRNILEQSPKSIDGAIEILTNETAIKKSLILPFRFLTAISEIEQVNYDRTRDVLIALNKAIDISLDNVPKFDGKTLVVLDCSGSMIGKPAKIGSLFASVLIKSNNADLILFANDAKYHTVNPMDSTLTIAKNIAFAEGGTNFHSIFQTANKPYDRIIILSDMQGWIGDDAPTAIFIDYKTRIGANPLVYSIDLNGYGTLQFPERNVFCIAGWSGEIFKIMELVEKDKNALINEIEKIEL